VTRTAAPAPAAMSAFALNAMRPISSPARTAGSRP
jgi:hypothetical protein